MIEWREEMSVGHPAIDDDHKRLIAIINDFERAAQERASIQTLHDTLLRLQDYANEHFSREEAVQRDCQFPFYAEHKREHDQLLMQVTEFARIYFIKRTRPITAETIAAMARFLHDWFADHTIRADLKMRRYVRRAYVDPVEYLSTDRPAA
jgi:hemerythrin-like metal-binding protein